VPRSPISLELFYAHTSAGGDPWKPLFTSFGEISLDEPTAACSGKGGEYCPHCEGLAPQHGHLNKVAYLSSRFAADMLPKGPDRECIRQWGYLAGL